MVGRSRLAAGSCAIALLAGCATTLDVQREPNDNVVRERAGIVQVLPFTQYEVTGTWRLISCKPGENNVTLKVAATAGTHDDPSQRYVIDPTSLQGPATRATFGVEYHEGTNTLKSVNADVEDDTAEVVGNIVSTIGSLAGPLTGLPTSAVRQPRAVQPTPTVCTLGAEQALQRVATLQPQLDQATRDVAEATDDVARLAAIVARLGDATPPATAAEFDASLRRLDSVTNSHARLAEQLRSALSAITVTRSVRWPQSGVEFDRETPLTIPDQAVRAWLNGTHDTARLPQAYLSIRTANGGVPTLVTGSAPTRTEPVRGIPYRLNVRGRLISCPERCLPGESSAQQTVLEGTVAQLGGVAVLPVRNPPLGSTVFSAAFNKDATLVTAGFTQRRAPLVQGTRIAADTTAGLAPLFDPSVRLERETEQLELLQRHRTAASALQPAVTTPTAEATAALAAETTLLDAQIANLQARITVQELQARLDPPGGR
jgi:hypothetical protein